MQDNSAVEEVIKERNRRIAIIQPLLSSGMQPTEISNKTGFNKEVVRHIIRNYCKRPDGYVSPVITGSTMMDWQSELDPSKLTDAQRGQAKRFGISEGRYAWLLSCPRTIIPNANQKESIQHD